MKSKTVRLGRDYRFEAGTVQRFVYETVRDSDGEFLEDKKFWEQCEMEVGDEVVLFSRENDDDGEVFDFTTDTDGISGNMNKNLKKFHGWRGTTGRTTIYAYGLRKITRIVALKNGIVAVKLGTDLLPMEP